MNELEELKIKKEIEKLDIEIKQISQLWWKNPSYLGVLLTFTSILVGIITGFIDVKNLEIGYKNQIDTLKANHFHRVDNLSKASAFKTDSLNKNLIVLKNKNDSFNAYNSELISINNALQLETEKTKNQTDIYLKEVIIKKKELKNIAITITDISKKRIGLNSQILLVCDYANTSMTSHFIQSGKRFDVYDDYAKFFLEDVKEYIDSTSSIYKKYEEIIIDMRKRLFDASKKDGKRADGFDLYKSITDDNRRTMLYYTDQYFNEILNSLFDSTKAIIK